MHVDHKLASFTLVAQLEYFFIVLASSGFVV